MRRAIFITMLALLLVLTATFSASAQTKITFSTWEGPDAEWEKTISEFEGENPDIKVELIRVPDQYEQKLLTMIAGKTAPDVMHVFEVTTPILAARGNLVNLDSLAEKDKAFDLDDFYPSTLVLGRYEGSLYGLGYAYAPQLMFYNNDLFSDAGLPDPVDGWTWSDMLYAATQITKDTNGDGKIDNWGFSSLTSWWVPSMIVIWQNSGDMFNEDKTETLLNTPADVQAIQFFADLIHRYKVAPPLTEQAGWGGSVFETGRIGMMATGIWMQVPYQNVKFEWDIVALPMNKEKATALHTSYFTISSQSKNQEAAWEFLKYVTGSKVQFEKNKNLGYVPTRASADERRPYVDPTKPPENDIAIGQTVEYGRLLPTALNMNRILNLFETELDLIYLGKKTAQEAFDKIAPEINELLKQE